MGSRGKDPGALLVGEDTTQGQAAGDPLGEGDHIRLDAELLEGEQAAGAADAGLHLVNEEEDILLPAQLGQALYKALVHGDDAALALDHLQHHGADRAVQQRLDARQIPGLGVEEALCQGEELPMEALLAGGGQGVQRPAVEGLL